MMGENIAPIPAALPFWLRPMSILGRFKFTTFKREFTYVDHAVHPCPSPLDASRLTVPSRFWSPFRAGYFVGALPTDRYLTAVARSVRVMEHPVMSPGGA